MLSRTARSSNYTLSSRRLIGGYDRAISIGERAPIGLNC